MLYGFCFIEMKGEVKSHLAICCLFLIEYEKGKEVKKGIVFLLHWLGFWHLGICTEVSRVLSVV